MKSNEARLILEKLINTFGSSSSLSEEQLREWGEYLQRQDFGVAKSVANWFQLHSDRPFMPNIPEFNAKLKVQQVEVSRREKARRDVTSCAECDGLTWLEEPTGVMPCPQCRPVTLKNWENGDYAAGLPPSPDELEGPKESYDMAASPNLITGPPVSVERARQWMEHLLSPSPSIYPEGDTIISEKEETSGF